MLLIKELLAPVFIDVEPDFMPEKSGGLKPQVQQYPKSIKGVLYVKELLSSKRSGARPDSGSS